MFEWLLIGVLVLGLLWEKYARFRDNRNAAEERRDLLNRIMTRDYNEYASWRQFETVEEGRKHEAPVVIDEEEDPLAADDPGIDPQEYQDLASKSESGFVNFIGPVRPD